MSAPAHTAAAGSGYAVEVREVNFAYAPGGFALRGVNLTLAPGSVVMVLGSSGSGKSTLLKLIKGLLRPHSGTIHVFGQEVSNGLGAEVRRRLGCRVAYIPQNLGLVRNLTALDNTLMGALGRTPTLPSMVKAFSPAERAEAQERLAELGIAAKAGEKVHNLSGGERQRVAIARALMQRPRLVLADEFVSQLDPVTTRHIMAAVRHAAAAGVTFLITSHEVELVAEFGERAVFFRHGEKVHECPAGEVSFDAVRDLMRR